MSSWLSFTLPNPFSKPSQDEDDEEENEVNGGRNPATPPTVVKDDISNVIGRQLRGVAAFLAPPPPPSPPTATAPSDGTSYETLLGIKNDLVEIGGSFKTSLSLLSSNKAVTEISRFATNLLQFGSEEEKAVGQEGVGITDEVVRFVGEIAKRPELWTDFPVELGYDFDMSNVQKEHTATIEDLVPSLTALRHEICKYLNEGQFWIIYFILLLPRLNENDSMLLSTPEIVKVRNILLQKLQNKSNAPVENSEVCETLKTFEDCGKDDNSRANESPFQGIEVLSGVIDAASSSKTDYHENIKWFGEEVVDTYSSIDAQKQSEDDISFSDLEDDDSDLSGKRPGYRRAEISRVPSCESSEWVQLNETLAVPSGQRKAVQSTSREKDSEGEESNEWLTIDDTDLDRQAAV